MTTDQPAARDLRISDIFYHFEEHTTVRSGRTVGRKIGVVQELILRTYLQQSEVLSRSLYLERKLVGGSGAGHKVEFSWFGLDSHRLCVGDEIPGTQGLVVASLDSGRGSVTLRRRDATRGGSSVGRQASLKGVLARGLPQNTDVRVAEVFDEACIVDVVDFTRLRASLESKRVGAQRFRASSKLGSGIQTIEKAKQASLVALDLDLAFNGTIKPLQEPDAPKQLLSFVALGNGVHWTNKDKAVLETYVDFTYLVKDSAIIRYAEYVKSLWKNSASQIEYIDFFSNYFIGMTKQAGDDFEVFDGDFEIIVPTGEKRSLREVLEAHLSESTTGS